MATIKVQKVPDVQLKQQSENEILKRVVATFCYYYPSYTFEEALELPVKTVRRMLKVVRKEQAMNYLELLTIHRAAGADKPTSYNKMIKQYEKDIRHG